MVAVVRLGLIGCGLISHAHGRAALKSKERIQFVACASRSFERAREWANTYGCDRAYREHGEMLREETLDGVVVATYPALHRRHVEDCIDAGVSFVLCEKPLTVSSEDARGILRKAATQGASVIEGLMYRHGAVMSALDALLPSVGRVDFIQATFNMRERDDSLDAKGPRDWRRQIEAGGGVPYDFACYPIDAANLLAGCPPVSVFARAESNPDHGTIDRLHGLIEYENGCRASFAASRRAVYSQALVVSGSDRRIHVPTAWTPLGPVAITVTTSTRFLETQEEEVIAGDGRVDGLTDLPAFQAQLEHFADVIRGRAQPRVTAAASLATAAVTESALASARSSSAVEVRA